MTIDYCQVYYQLAEDYREADKDLERRVRSLKYIEREIEREKAIYTLRISDEEAEQYIMGDFFSKYHRLTTLRSIMKLHIERCQQCRNSARVAKWHILPFLKLAHKLIHLMNQKQFRDENEVINRIEKISNFAQFKPLEFTQERGAADVFAKGIKDQLKVAQLRKFFNGIKNEEENV
jgi:hypothetical protein